MRAEETPEQKQLRKDFELDLQYRNFCERRKDGTYLFEWVETRWQGFAAHARFMSELSVEDRRERFEALWAKRHKTGSNWKPCRSHAPGDTDSYEDATAQQAWVMFNLALGIRI